MASSSAFLTGTLRERASESAPSATIHFAFGSMPVSSSRVESLTPVHSEQETRPCTACTLAWLGSLETIGGLLPPHSTNLKRDTIGERASVSRVKPRGWLTVQWITRRASCG